MKFIKNWNQYLNESILSKKREEIKNKISKIEADLHLVNTNVVDTKTDVIDTNAVPTEAVDTTQMELKLESLKIELDNLK